MIRFRFVAVAGLCALTIPLGGQSAVDVAASRRLAGATLVEGRSYAYVSELTGTFGSRLTGSPAYQRAAEWAIAQFKAAGISAVKAEPFTIAHAWERGAASARMVSPLERPLHVESLGWMPSTPDEGVEGNVALVADLAPAAISAAALNGRIALVMPHGARAIDDQLVLEAQLDRRLRDAGAVATLWADDAPGNVLAARLLAFGTDIGRLPSAQIGQEDAQLIRRLLDKGPVRVTFAFRNRISAGPVVVNNVIAEIRGREHPDEWVIVGAHLDSWDFATGAQDNGTGVAMVLDAARAIAALAQPPRRSIRFALWGGEEQGLAGSRAYVHAHDADLAHCIANINTDGGSGRVLGFLTPGRRDVAAALRPISEALLAGLGAGGIDESMRYAFESDDGAFILQGIPALDLNPDDAKYEDIHHTPSDTMDRVNRHDLAVGAATVAITAYALADAAQPIGRRLDHAAIASMLAAARMDRVLEAYGWWKAGSP